MKSRGRGPVLREVGGKLMPVGLAAPECELTGLATLEFEPVGLAAPECEPVGFALAAPECKPVDFTALKWEPVGLATLEWEPVGLAALEWEPLCTATRKPVSLHLAVPVSSRFVSLAVFLPAFTSSSRFSCTFITAVAQC